MLDVGRWLCLQRTWRWIVFTLIVFSMVVTWMFAFNESVLVYDVKTAASSQKGNLMITMDECINLRSNSKGSNLEPSAKGNNVKSKTKGSKFKPKTKGLDLKDLSKGTDFKPDTKEKHLKSSDKESKTKAKERDFKAYFKQNAMGSDLHITAKGSQLKPNAMGNDLNSTANGSDLKTKAKEDDSKDDLNPNAKERDLEYTEGTQLNIGTKGIDLNSTAKGSNFESNLKGNKLKSTTKGSNLMIVSYMRGGSSMNGKVFGENPETFYLFEPISKYAPHGYLTEKKLCTMAEKHCRIDHDGELRLKTLETNSTEIENVKTAPVWELREGVINTLKTIYSCDIANLDDVVLRKIMFGWLHHKHKSGESWQNFTTCYINLVEPNVTDYFHYALKASTTEFDKHKNIFRLLEQGGSKAKIFKKCLNQLVTHCKQTKLRVTKVLRLSLRFLPLLMVKIPDLKFLFVIRDPRGIINSRIRTDWYGIAENDTEAVNKNIKSLCFKMLEDIKMVDRLKKDYPGRFLDFRLDEIVKESMKTYKKIFKFANLQMTDKYLEKINEVVQAKQSFLTQWRDTLKPQYINLTQQYCHQSLKKYGFAEIDF